MTREQTKWVLALISSTYPNFRPADLKMTLDAWTVQLSGDDFEKVSAAVIAYNREDTSGFAPTIGQILQRVSAMSMKELTENEAWGIAYKAICDSAYHAQERFDELPAVIKRAVGSPDTLRSWGTEETDLGVIQSHFIRSYRTALNREKMEAALPMARQVMDQLEMRCNDGKRLSTTKAGT